MSPLEFIAVDLFCAGQDNVIELANLGPGGVTYAVEDTLYDVSQLAQFCAENWDWFDNAVAAYVGVDPSFNDQAGNVLIVGCNTFTTQVGW